MAEHGGVVRGGARLSGLQLMDAQLLRLEEEFRRVVRREDARRALLTPQELEDERARKMETRACVPLFLSYDYSYPPLQWTVVRQQEGDNLPPLEELARASSAGAQAARGPFLAVRVPVLEADVFEYSTGVLCTRSPPTTVLALLPSLPYPATSPRPSRGYM
jgi:hypothetical protein